jgi:D-alanyl-D-alanine dipeptidase
MKKIKIATYQELFSIPVRDNGEPLVDVRSFDPEILAEYTETERKTMIYYTGGKIFVRKTVAEKLAKINKILKKKYKFYLKIVSGYRHPEVQRKYFEKKYKELQRLYPYLKEEELKKLTHNFVAVPEVAGHPTGGAIDVTVVNEKGKELDMGTKIGDFSNEEKIKTFAKGISKKQLKNRLFLHDLLIKEKFAPFYGEWWHFSYGDREWAYFYNKKKTLYSPIDFKIKKSSRKR